MRYLKHRKVIPTAPETPIPPTLNKKIATLIRSHNPKLRTIGIEIGTIVNRVIETTPPTRVPPPDVLRALESVRGNIESLEPEEKKKASDAFSEAEKFILDALQRAITERKVVETAPPMLEAPDISVLQNISGFLAAIVLALLSFIIDKSNLFPTHFPYILEFFVISIIFLFLATEFFAISKGRMATWVDGRYFKDIITKSSIGFYEAGATCYNLGVSAIAIGLVFLFDGLGMVYIVLTIYAFLLIEIALSISFLGNIRGIKNYFCELIKEKEKNKLDDETWDLIKKIVKQEDLCSGYKNGYYLHILTVLIMFILLAFSLIMIGFILS